MPPRASCTCNLLHLDVEPMALIVSAGTLYSIGSHWSLRPSSQPFAISQVALGLPHDHPLNRAIHRVLRRSSGSPKFRTRLSSPSDHPPPHYSSPPRLNIVGGISNYSERNVWKPLPCRNFTHPDGHTNYCRFIGCECLNITVNDELVEELVVGSCVRIVWRFGER
ncbi:hypothetical protein JAAARDRAFT_475577 [Jaapia argillacea MUCL 33604]|uniref:Uncharacterized protein n=1 Tax=Jaapia argillacea MUCL 33604 TaxID=933084 RepID=A0A067PN59_9AGAM|nr:hypothetical protein JAAARDRAFT_475577 [Jaapia argillacea MUCL 33604]